MSLAGCYHTESPGATVEGLCRMSVRKKRMARIQKMEKIKNEGKHDCQPGTTVRRNKDSPAQKTVLPFKMKEMARE